MKVKYFNFKYAFKFITINYYYTNDEQEVAVEIKT